jgi:hypothetical protein
MQQQHQRGTLPQGMRNLTLPNEAQRLVHNGFGKFRAMGRQRSRHDATPFANQLPAQDRIITIALSAKQPYKDL